MQPCTDEDVTFVNLVPTCRCTAPQPKLGVSRIENCEAASNANSRAASASQGSRLRIHRGKEPQSYGKTKRLTAECFIKQKVEDQETRPDHQAIFSQTAAVLKS